MKLIRLTSIVIAFLTTVFPGSIRAQNAGQGAPAFHSVKEVVDLLPRQLMMKLKVPSQSESAKTEANTVLSQNVQGKFASWKVKVVKWEPWDAPGEVPSKFRIQPVDQLMNVNGLPLGIRMWIYLPADAGPVVTKLARGAEVTVTGAILRADITTNKGEGPKLNFDMTRTKIEHVDSH